MSQRVKVGRIVAPIVILAAVYGGYYAHQHGYLAPADASSASIPQVATLPELPPAVDPVQAAAAVNVTPIPQPGEAVTVVAAPQIRSAHMAWNAQFALPYANGGPLTTQGSLMEKHGVNLKLIREDDDGKMQTSLANFASDLAKGNPQPTDNYQFMTDMGDGTAVIVANINSLVDKMKLGPQYHAEIIASFGFSRGEDKIQGPAEWVTNPKAARGSLIAVALRSGDWDIVMKWASDNQILVNPNEKTWNPAAINFYAADDFIKAGEAYINSVCEDRPVVIDGKRNGETQHACVNAVASWTPVDVNVAMKKGGLVKVVSTKEYRSQMPAVLIGIKKWDQDNRKEIEDMLSAVYEAADQVKAFPDAQQRAATASWEVYGKEETPAYWLKYYKGAMDPDKTGVKVELGGSAISNLQDVLQLFGLVPGSANVFAATYTVFGDIVHQQYPKLVPSYPPVGDVLNTSFIQNVAKTSESKTVADLPVYRATTDIKNVVSKRSWSINFDTGKATFTPDSIKQLSELRNGLLIADELSIAISGHTDNTGDPANNLTLSRARAEAVKAWLMGQSLTHFPARRFVSVDGFGDTKPLPGTGNDEAGRALNRRVEITLGT
jgi:outer membrane protein OmpA-like peptidoglycan-associated protein